MKKIKISHTILYIKGWYRVSENIFTDLRVTLKADGYSTDLFTDDDIVNVLLNRFEECNLLSHSLAEFVKYTRNCNSKESYYQKVIDYIFGKFIWFGNEDWEIIRPDYNKVLPLPEDKTLEGVYEMFNEYVK